jgi:hypothetical protein
VVLSTGATVMVVIERWHNQVDVLPKKGWEEVGRIPEYIAPGSCCWCRTFLALPASSAQTGCMSQARRESFNEGAGETRIHVDNNRGLDGCPGGGQDGKCGDPCPVWTDGRLGGASDPRVAGKPGCLAGARRGAMARRSLWLEGKPAGCEPLKGRCTARS